MVGAKDGWLLTRSIHSNSIHGPCLNVLLGHLLVWDALCFLVGALGVLIICVYTVAVMRPNSQNKLELPSDCCLSTDAEHVNES